MCCRHVELLQVSSLLCVYYEDIICCPLTVPAAGVAGAAVAAKTDEQQQPGWFELKVRPRAWVRGYPCAFLHTNPDSSTKYMADHCGLHV
jgi:hypothetical protein